MAATTLVAFRLPTEEHEALEAATERAGTTKTAVIREALRRHLEAAGDEELDT